jgi:hypothetical protein
MKPFLGIGDYGRLAAFTIAAIPALIVSGRPVQLEVPAQSMASSSSGPPCNVTASGRTLESPCCQFVTSGGENGPSQQLRGLLAGRSSFPRLSLADQQPGDCRALGHFKLGYDFFPLVDRQVGQKLGDHLQAVGAV